MTMLFVPDPKRPHRMVRVPREAVGDLRGSVEFEREGYFMRVYQRSGGARIDVTDLVAARLAIPSQNGVISADEEYTIVLNLVRAFPGIDYITVLETRVDEATQP